VQARRETVAATQPNPMVAAVSMAWDRDMQERFLQLIERMAKAAEEQAEFQKHMSGSWAAMSDHQRDDMNKKIERLLEALEDAEGKKDVLSMIAAATGR
jgi:ABC-type phosphate/phosphonate transport system substrate-binding protein